MFILSEFKKLKDAIKNSQSPLIIKIIGWLCLLILLYIIYVSFAVFFDPDFNIFFLIFPPPLSYLMALVASLLMAAFYSYILISASIDAFSWNSQNNRKKKMWGLLIVLVVIYYIYTVVL